MRIPACIPCASRCGGAVTLAWIALAWLGLSGTASANTAPDIYEALGDDGIATTRNIIEQDVPQKHTLHSTTNKDWSIFIARETSDSFTNNYQFSIILPASGSHIDPNIYIQDSKGTIWTQDDIGNPGTQNNSGLGESELRHFDGLPPGEYFIRIQNAGTTWGDDASYTLSVTRDFGANNGVAQITSIGRGPTGGTVPLSPSTPRAAAKSGVPAPLDHDYAYSSRYVQFFAGASPSLSSTQVVTFGHPIDMELAAIGAPLFQATSKWLQRNPKNYTITMLQVGTSQYQPGTLTFPTPIKLFLQQEDGRDEVGLGVIDDIPAGRDVNKTRVMIWKPSTNAWQVFDAAPTKTSTGLWSTSISTISGFTDTASMNEAYFGLEVPAPVLNHAGDEWALYP